MAYVEPYNLFDFIKSFGLFVKRPLLITFKKGSNTSNIKIQTDTMCCKEFLKVDQYCISLFVSQSF